jgi:hypothetical protein
MCMGASRSVVRGAADDVEGDGRCVEFAGKLSRD